MKKLIYLLTFSLSMVHSAQTAQISVTQQQEISVADQEAFKSMLTLIKDPQLLEETRYKKVAALLEEHPRIVNAHNTYGYTALTYAAWKGRTKIVKLLIAAGANINAQATDGWTALMFATYNGHTEIVQLLIAAGADHKDGNKTARHYADDTVAYDAAVQEGLAEKARRERYKKDQVAAKTIIAQEVTHVTPLVDMISAYVYDPHNPEDLGC